MKKSQKSKKGDKKVSYGSTGNPHFPFVFCRKVSWGYPLQRPDFWFVWGQPPGGRQVPGPFGRAQLETSGNPRYLRGAGKGGEQTWEIHAETAI